MRNKHDTLGIAIKSARERNNITVEDLAARVGITKRYLYRIENEGQRPRYDLLYKLIRTLSIPADTIFYSEMADIESETGDLIRMLCRCGKRFLTVTKSMLQALIDATFNL